MWPAPWGRKRPCEVAELFAETRKLDADIFTLLITLQINEVQRDAVTDRLARARLLADSGKMEEARSVVMRVVGVVAGWRR